MVDVKQVVITGWKRARAATRLWWVGVACVTTSALIVVAVTSVADATGHTGPTNGANGSGMAASPASGSGRQSTGSGSASMGSMGSAGSARSAGSAENASSGSPGATGSMGSSGSTTAAGICPNVTGSTTMPNGMVMAPVPSAPPTDSQQAAAATLVSQTEQGISQYDNVSVAESDGYMAISQRQLPMTHYLNPSVIKSGDVLDPSQPSALMYANTVDGPVLIGAMYMGAAPCQPGPDVGGSLTQWHAHDNLCTMGGQLVGRTTASGSCNEGTHKATTYFMLHVWTAPQLASQYQFQADLPAAGNAVIRQIDATGQR